MLTYGFLGLSHGEKSNCFQGHFNRLCDYFIWKYTFSVCRDECTFVSLIPFLEIKLLCPGAFPNGHVFGLCIAASGPTFWAQLKSISCCTCSTSSFLFFFFSSSLLCKPLPFPLLAFTFFSSISEVTVLSIPKRFCPYFQWDENLGIWVHVFNLISKFTL